MTQDRENLRIGILGAARIVPNAIIRPARRVPGVCVAAIAARDAQRAAVFARKHSIPTAAASYSDLLNDPTIDAIYIPLPNALHTEWSLRALAAGKHVLCEKPLAANSREAMRIAAAAAQPGAPLFMEAFHNRYHPLVARMKALLASGELGALREVRAIFRTPMLRRTDIRFDYDLAGGATMDLGCYMVSLLRYVTGEEPIVEHAVATLLHPQVDRRMRATLRLPSGVAATMDVEMKARRIYDIRFEAICEAGRLVVVNPVLPHIFHLFSVCTPQGKRREWFSRTATYDYQLRAFAAAIRDGGPVPTDAVEGVRTMRVIDAIYQAAGLRLRGGA